MPKGPRSSLPDDKLIELAQVQGGYSVVEFEPAEEMDELLNPPKTPAELLDKAQQPPGPIKQ